MTTENQLYLQLKSSSIVFIFCVNEVQYFSNSYFELMSLIEPFKKRSGVVVVCGSGNYEITSDGIPYLGRMTLQALLPEKISKTQQCTLLSYNLECYPFMTLSDSRRHSRKEIICISDSFFALRNTPEQYCNQNSFLYIEDWIIRVLNSKTRECIFLSENSDSVTYRRTACKLNRIFYPLEFSDFGSVNIAHLLTFKLVLVFSRHVEILLPLIGLCVLSGARCAMVLNDKDLEITNIPNCLLKRYTVKRRDVKDKLEAGYNGRRTEVDEKF